MADKTKTIRCRGCGGEKEVDADTTEHHCGNCNTTTSYYALSALQGDGS